MRLNQMTALELGQLGLSVETALQTNPKKMQIVKTISDLGHCSPKSSGIERTLLKLLNDAKIPLPPTFAKVMSASQTRTPTTATSLFLGLRSISTVRVCSKNGKNSATVTFADGCRKLIGNFDVSGFSSKLGLIALNES